MASARQRFLAAEDEDELMALQVCCIQSIGENLILKKAEIVFFTFL